MSLLASHYGVRGVGIWALGMESDDTQMIATLDGISPGAPPGTVRVDLVECAGHGLPGHPCGFRFGGLGGVRGARAPASATPASGASGGGAGATSASVNSPATSTPPAAPTTTTTAAFITGIYNGATVALTPIPSSEVLGLVPAGTLTDFQTDEVEYSCLDGVSLDVYDNVNGTAVAEAITPSDCIAQDFQLP